MRKLTIVLITLLTVLISGCSLTTEKQSEGQPGSNTATEAKAKSDFPKKPIELIVPFGSGGGPDILARTLAEAASKHLPNGQTVVVVNKPGGSSTIGLTEVFNAKPDGYKIGLTTPAPISIQPHFGKTIYSYDGFQPIIRVVSDPNVFIVKADAPWKNIDEWIAYVKANPGKFTYGSIGVGSIPHIIMESINSKMGVKSKMVSFESGSQALNAVLGGHVQGTLVFPQTAIPQIENGKVRALAVVGTATSKKIENIPTMKEKGVDFDININISTGIIAPKGLPEDVSHILHDAFKKALEDPSLIEQFEKLGYQTSYANNEEYKKDIADTYNLSHEVLKSEGFIK